MLKTILFLFLVAFSSAKAEENATTTWKNAVEDILSRVALGPVKKEFTPSYIAKRTKESAMKLQTSHFRAKVATGIIQSISDKVIVCIDSTISNEAVEIILNEFKSLEFDVFWLYKTEKCVNGGLLFNIPKPAE